MGWRVVGGWNRPSKKRPSRKAQCTHLFKLPTGSGNRSEELVDVLELGNLVDGHQLLGGAQPQDLGHCTRGARNECVHGRFGHRDIVTSKKKASEYLHKLSSE